MRTATDAPSPDDVPTVVAPREGSSGASAPPLSGAGAAKAGGLRLRTQFFLAAALLVVVTLGAAVALSTWRANRIAEESIREALRTIPGDVAVYRAGLESQLKATLRSVAEEPGIKAIFDSPAATVWDTAKDKAAILNARTFFFFDRAGVLIARSDRPPSEEERRSFREVAWVSSPLEEWTESSATIREGAALAVVAAILAANALSRPVRALAESVHLMSEGDLSQRVEVPGTYELAELAEGFNHMGGELEKSIEKLKLAARENQELFLNSIRALAAAVDAKDPYTRGHSERVARYSVAIARHLGQPVEEVRKVRIAALLHDVGKIGIDDRILRKPTALTDDEFEIMKLHPVKGALIMGQIPQLKWIIPGMKYHHEKWDGTGYPDGLKGEEIPMLARIISVADTFDAMTTTRPYQKAMRSDYVVSRIKTFAGTRYDTSVIEALEEALLKNDLEVIGEAARMAEAS